jgi:hypothetical protein
LKIGSSDCGQPLPKYFVVFEENQLFIPKVFILGIDDVLQLDQLQMNRKPVQWEWCDRWTDFEQ